MTRKLFLIALVSFVTCVSFPAEAATFHVEFPLAGKNLYGAASGTVSFTEFIGEPKRDDGTELTIEVKNVPLPPGTELRVYVHEMEVGKFKLTKDRSGKFALQAKYPKSTPRLKTGSLVSVKLEDGTIVVW